MLENSDGVITKFRDKLVLPHFWWQLSFSIVLFLRINEPRRYIIRSPDLFKVISVFTSTQKSETIRNLLKVLNLPIITNFIYEQI